MMDTTKRRAARADDSDDWFVESYGLVHGIGTVSTLGGDKPLPKGWTPPAREFPIGFHVAAPGPSHAEPRPEGAKRKPRRAAAAPAGKRPAARKPRA